MKTLKASFFVFIPLFSLPSPSVFCFWTFGVGTLLALLYQKQMLRCSWVEWIPKVNCKDEIKGKWVITSQTELVQEMECVLLWLQRKTFHRKDAKYTAHWPKSHWKTGNYFWRSRDRYIKRFLNVGKTLRLIRWYQYGLDLNWSDQVRLSPF